VTDYYEILGIERTATDAEIRDAYRKIAQSVHPDKGGGVDEFQAISTAYRTLIDPERRARYDRGDENASGPKPQSPEQKARERLAMLFQQTVLAMKEGQDIVKIMRESLIAGRMKMQADIGKAEMATANIERVRGKMHYKGDDDGNVFEGIMNQLHDSNTRQINQLSHEIDIMDMTIEMLDNYEFEVEQIAHSGVGYRAATSTTGWYTT